MNKQEIEALVLSAVDRVLNGKKVEDSLIECKSDWPDPTKARQLAGHANRGRGEDIVWIIGLDEKSGRLTSPVSPDLADWWAKMSSRFDDHVVPDMRDLRVQVNADDAVTALVFSTDRTPYVVKVADAEGRVEREVPIRDGTRTRSAYRHELMRLLRPAMASPPMTLIFAQLSGRFNSSDAHTGVSFYLDSHLYVEQGINETVMIPHHLMKFYVHPSSGGSQIDDVEIGLDPYFMTDPPNGATGLGVNKRRDGITIAGGAVLDVKSQGFLSGASYADYNNVQSCNITISLGVAGAARPIIINETLKATILRDPTEPINNLFGQWDFPRDR